MRRPKVGDKIVVTKFDGESIEPAIRTIEEIKEEKALMKMDEPIGDNYVIEHDDWIWNDDWRFATRDELINEIYTNGDAVNEKA